MSSMREEWLNEQLAESHEALKAGDGCHPDEVKALGSYFNGSLTAKEAAEKITSPVCLESNPQEYVCRLWGLLACSMVELGEEECDKTITLLDNIRQLPSTSTIDWSDLTGFGIMWSDMHRLHFHGSGGWEKESMTAAKRALLREYDEAIGTAEAKMYILDFIVPPYWGYEVINLVCSNRCGLGVLLGEVHAWLKVAGPKLKGSIQPNEMETFPRSVVDGSESKEERVSATLAEHWAAWEKALVNLSGNESPLPDEDKEVAIKCLALMREDPQPWRISDTP